jgi:hypothetical protein
MLKSITSFFAETIHDFRISCCSSSEPKGHHEAARAASLIYRIVGLASAAIAATSVGFLAFSENVHNNGAYIALNTGIAVSATVISHDFLVMAKNVRESFFKGMDSFVTKAKRSLKNTSSFLTPRDIKIIAKGTWLFGKCGCNKK